MTTPSEPSLQVSFRHGHPVAAYFHLVLEPDVRASRNEVREPGLVVDFDDGGRAIGIEITRPGDLTVDAFNAVLEELGHGPVGADDLAPLRVA